MFYEKFQIKKARFENQAFVLGVVWEKPRLYISWPMLSLMPVKLRLNFISFVFLLFSVFGSLDLNSQTATSSPYSRYGVGELQFNGFASNFLMGGTGIGIYDTLNPYYINLLNPAGYTSLKRTVFETAVNSSTFRIANNNGDHIANSTSFGYLALAYPVNTKWWGQTFGIMPYSSVGYEISDTETFTSLGEVEYRYEGSGGINQIFFGNGFKPWVGAPARFMKSSRRKNLLEKRNPEDTTKAIKILKRKNAIARINIGANGVYYFGSMNNIRRDIFSDVNSFNTRITKQTSVSDVGFNFGANYSWSSAYGRNDSVKIPGKEKRLEYTIGLVYSMASDLSAKSDVLAETYKLLGSYEAIRDTILNFTDQKGDISLPSMYGIGFSVRNGTKWLFAADFAMQQWEELKFFNDPAGLRNSFRGSIGVRYKPVISGAKDAYWKYAQYRGGLRYSQTALELKNTGLSEYALSLGMSMPLGPRELQQSMMSVGFELGQRGTKENGLIQERFARVTIGFTITDRWFQRYKID